MKTMRDCYLELIADKMISDNSIYFLTADFGAPVLDKMRNDFPKRVINVGVAEQNMINVAVGLATEGAKVFCFAIAPFITMRCYEQIRTCISVFSMYRHLSIQLIGVGAGFSYDLSGPTHHCLEDLVIMRALPRIQIHSPSDTSSFQQFFNWAYEQNGVIYHRFDSKAQPLLEAVEVNNDLGFRFLVKNGSDTLVVSTGYASSVILREKEKLPHRADIIDVWKIGKKLPLGLAKILNKYQKIHIISEEFSYASALSAYLSSSDITLSATVHGFNDYDLHQGGREAIWRRSGVMEILCK